MYLLILKNYINNLDKNTISLFAFKNNIFLSTLEVDYIYNTIKNNYETLLSNNYMQIFEEAKNHLSDDNYQKIYNLYLDYRLKYQFYLN